MRPALASDFQFTEAVLLVTGHWELPTKKFQEDIDDMALHLTNYVLRRRLEVVNVIIYWVVNVSCVEDIIVNAMKKSGGDVITLHTSVIRPEIYDEQLFQIEWDDWEEDVVDEISRIVKNQHPAAVEMLPPQLLQSLPCAFYCIESNANFFDEWCFDWVEPYAELLPIEFRATAVTWLALIQSEVWALDLFDVSEEQQFMMNAIALLYLLHQFHSLIIDETTFDPDYDISFSEIVDIVPISGVYLGSMLDEEELQDICDQCDGRQEELRGAALKATVNQIIADLIPKLSESFGSSTGLFYTLLSSCQPQFSIDVGKRFQQVVNEGLLPWKLEAFELLQA